MDNQHRHIKGYRELSQEEIDLMNQIKAKGEELRELVQKIEAISIPPLQSIEVQPDDTSNELVVGLPLSIATEGDHPAHWLRWADSSFRAGIMYAVRAVAQPTSY
ncbi:MAG: hypothetical protein KBF33_01660 [Comamonas sp.]|nr:hypothetical protein [Comamonas sp.]